ncbi:cytochrome c family protein [Desulfovibrio sp. OttesenSCG-928-A18]|nr:cytochrome c family protein [Desulfovibrio sp. OttesenSCG-928-A18]
MALAFGWWVFPDLIFSKQSQPFYFSHNIHMEKVGTVCSDCHSFRADGSFTGVPALGTCAGCHGEIQTDEPSAASTPAEKAAYEAEKFFVEEYVAKGREVPWLRHQYQPDNVFFSHAAHFSKCYSCHLTMKGSLSLGTPDNPDKLCMTCHPSLAELDKNIPVAVNVLTDYSASTMKMWECERCHALPGHFYNDGKGRTAANNACYTCHK